MLTCSENVEIDVDNKYLNQQDVQFWHNRLIIIGTTIVTFAASEFGIGNIANTIEFRNMRKKY